MRPASEHLREALALHRQGRLQEAARVYQSVLTADPNHIEALHLLGVVALQSGQRQRGVDLIGKALSLNPNHAEALSNLGNGYRALGRSAEAIAAYDRAIALAPRMVEAQLNRGLALLDQGRLDAALAAFDQTLTLKPDYASAHCNRGNALHALKRLEAAEASFQRALALNPQMAEAHANRANVLSDLGRAEEALASLERALQLQPQFVPALVSRGLTLLALARAHDAVSAFDAAIACAPHHAPAHVGRGCALFELGRTAAALASHDVAIALDPAAAAGHAHRGLALLRLNRAQEAIESADRALAADADLDIALLCRGNALAELGRLEEALVDFEHLARTHPNLDGALGLCVGAKLKLSDWSGLDAWIDRLTETLNEGVRSSGPFLLLQVMDAPALHLKCAQLYAPTQRAVAGVTEPLVGGILEKLRIGYFSSDFHNHPVAHLIGGALANHDRDRFEVFAFSFRRQEDAWRKRIRDSVDHFVDVSDQSAAQIVDAARAARIDIAIDLNGYTKDARTSIFATRVAPVQAAYLGYLGTSGADYIDYLVADRALIQPEQRRYYSENVIYLPWYQCVDESANAPGAPGPRTDYGLPERGFVFGSFNSNFKITPTLFDVWMRVLRAVPGSVLWLYADNPVAKQNLVAAAAERGLETHRLIFLERQERAQHLARQQHVDLFLDTFPYNGGATTSNALRAGVPVLTLAGESFASRMGASLLSALGMDTLITSSAADYEEKAVHLATSPAALAALRGKIANVGVADLFGAPVFTRRLESAYLAAIERFRAGLPAADIVVD